MALPSASRIDLAAISNVQRYCASRFLLADGQAENDTSLTRHYKVVGELWSFGFFILFATSLGCKCRLIGRHANTLSTTSKIPSTGLQLNAGKGTELQQQSPRYGWCDIPTTLWVPRKRCDAKSKQQSTYQKVLIEMLVVSSPFFLEQFADLDWIEQRN